MAVIVFYTDTHEVQRDEGISFEAVSWTMQRPWTDGIEQRISANTAKWRAAAQAEAYDTTSSEVRSKRDELLAETDYIMAVDYPATESKKTAVSEYRQALRDIPSQDGFPYDVTWPRV